MNSPQPLNEATLARECLQRLSEDTGALGAAAHVLELISRSDGLGEVLRDFARQTSGQLRDLMAASRRACSSMRGSDDGEIFDRAHMVIKTARQVLEMTPTAMQRNKAEAVGDEKNKMSRADITQASHTFQESPDVQRLLAAEDAGKKLAALVAGESGEGSLAAPDQAAASQGVHR